MTLRCLLLALLAPGIAAAAEPPVQNAPIHEWPSSGAWRVLMVRARSLNGAPACLLMTGYASAGTEHYRVWGFRAGPGEVLAIVNASDGTDAAGDALAVQAGGTWVGRYAVTQRPERAGQLSTAIAAIPATDQDHVLTLLGKPGPVKLRTGTVVLSEDLDAVSAAHFAQCQKGDAPLS